MRTKKGVIMDNLVSFVSNYDRLDDKGNGLINKGVEYKIKIVGMEKGVPKNWKYQSFMKIEDVFGTDIIYLYKVGKKVGFAIYVEKTGIYPLRGYILKK